MPAQGRPQAAGRSSQFQPGKYEPARNQPEANQTSFFDSPKPAKPGKQRPDLARQPGPCRELRKCSLFRDVQGEIDAWAASQAHTWNCAIYFASFVGGAVPAQGRPQAAGRSSQFQPGKYEPARSQPEANQTFFSNSQKPAKPGKQRPDLARQPGPCRELRKCSLFRDVQGEIDAWAASQAHTWNCAIYFASFVGGAVPAQGRPQAAGRSSQFQPGKYEIFPGREASQKTTKPLFLIARSQPNQASRGPDLARQPGPCRELRKCSLFRDAQGEIDWAAAIYFASFVGGAVPAQGRPQAAGRSSQFQPGKYEPARSQPEANQTFLIARSQPNQASRGLIWQGSLGLAGS